MADWNAKTATPDSTIPDDNAGLIGADSQSATTPSWYSFGTIKAWIKSWIVKADVGLGNVLNVAQNAKLMQGNYRSGRYYLPFGYTVSSAATPPANSMRMIPVVFLSDCTLVGLNIRTGTGNAQNVQGAIYASNPTNNLPTGNALGTTPSVSTPSSASNYDLTFSSAVAVTAGLLYYLVINTDGSTATYTSFPPNIMAQIIGSTSSNNPLGGGESSYTFAQTFGTWPDMTSNTPSEANLQSAPIIAFKVQ